ncbi:nitric oxide dioxygenase [Pelomyxa schiedti]|nr:nitric oxide dioxygenase [Pelomyxa schiedti]
MQQTTTAPWISDWRSDIFNRGEKEMQQRDNMRDRAQSLGEHKVATEVHPDSINFLSTRHAIYVGYRDVETGEVWLTPIYADPTDLIPCSSEVLQGLSEHPDATPLSEDSFGDEPCVVGSLSAVPPPTPSSESQEDYPPTTSSIASSAHFCDACGVYPDSARMARVFQSNAYRQLVCVEKPCLVRVLKPPPVGDPLWKVGANSGTPISLTFLEFETRKRYRIAGVVCDPVSSNGFSVTVMEAFSICPRYIQSRTIDSVRKCTPSCLDDTTLSDGHKLPNSYINFITSSDTFFISTANPELVRGVDTSHRGGRPGFVRIIDGHKLAWGDYHGKGMFQVLGNTLIDHHAGITFLDFERGHTLQFTGVLDVHWLPPHQSLDNCDRLCVFTPTRWRLTACASPFHWKFLSFSTHHPPLFDIPANSVILLQPDFALPKWHSAAAQWKNLGTSWDVAMQLVGRRKESANVTTFIWRTSRSVRWEPGQYSTFRFDIGGEEYLRCWSISTAAFATVPTIEESATSKTRRDRYEIEISVKRQGKVTGWLHDTAIIGETSGVMQGIEGGFTLPVSFYIQLGNRAPTYPFSNWWRVLMITAGSGVTPVISMLRGLRNTFSEKIVTEHELPDIVSIHVEREYQDIPFKTDWESLTSGTPIIRKFLVALTRTNLWDGPTDYRVDGVCYGHLTEEFLQREVPQISERLVYLCGPNAFMGATTHLLTKCGVKLTWILNENYDY